MSNIRQIMSNITGSSNISKEYDSKQNKEYDSKQNFTFYIRCKKKLDLNQNVAYEIRGGLENKKLGNVCPDCYKKEMLLIKKMICFKMF